MLNLPKKLSALFMALVVIFGSVHISFAGEAELYNGQDFIAVESVTPAALGIMPLSDTDALLATINAAFGPGVASLSATTITVSQPTLTPSYTVILDIPPGITLDWNGNYSASLSGYLIDVRGSGIFNVNGVIRNSYTGGAVTLGGAGTEINISDTGSVISDRPGSSIAGGTALSITANNITVNITGYVSALDGSNSAIIISAGLSDVKLNLTGATIRSLPGGVAIYDGSSTDISTNNTEITLSNGSHVEAGTGSAIRSTGASSLVTIESSIVENSVSTNISPAIYMNGGTGKNIIIYGYNTYIRANGENGFAVQTTGDVELISGNITSIGGRSINLVGSNSVALVRGGSISTVTGTAISTATTAGVDVTNTSIDIRGGTVKATGDGNAIQTTGANSQISISGGQVIAKEGYAIHPLAANTVNITDGFVFAVSTRRGVTGTGNVISRGNINISNNGVVVGWGRPPVADSPPYFSYYEGEIIDIYELPLGNGAYWHKTSVGNHGIQFRRDIGNDGHFPMWVSPWFVQIMPQSDFGLIFDIGEGLFYRSDNGQVYTDQANRWNWEATSRTLSLSNFRFSTNTSAAPALRIRNGDNITLNLGGVNSFSSTGVGSNLAGIISEANIFITELDSGLTNNILNTSANSGVGLNMADRNLTLSSGIVNVKAGSGGNNHGLIAQNLLIEGGSLNAASGSQSGIASGGPYGLLLTNLTMTGTTAILTASGNHGAIGPVTVLSLPATYIYYQGITANSLEAERFSVPPNSAFTINEAHRYVQIQAREAEIIVVPPPPPPFVRPPANDTTESEAPSTGGIGTITARPRPIVPQTTPQQEYEYEYADEEYYYPAQHDHHPHHHETVEVLEGHQAAAAAMTGDVSAFLITGEHKAYIVGIGNNLFAPDSFASRADIVQMFYNLLFIESGPHTRSFPDVPEDAWYWQAVSVLTSLGLLSGFPDGSFRPSDHISRAEFITIAVQFTHIHPEYLASLRFFDVPSTHWAQRFICIAVHYGWVSGYGDGSFRPDQALTRAEAVTVINRMLNRRPDKEFINRHPNLPQFYDVPRTHWAFYEIAEAAILHDFIAREEEDYLEEHWEE